MAHQRQVSLLISTLVLVYGVKGAPLDGTHNPQETVRALGPIKTPIPEAEQELESLKNFDPSHESPIRIEDHKAAGGLGDKGQTLASVPVKLAVNLEKPAVSDNSRPDSIMSSSEQQQATLTKATEKRRDEPKLNLETDYTPQDIAEYIFWTGDERGVALALNDFLQDGLVSKKDAIHFLEQVKAELKLLRARYVPEAGPRDNSSKKEGNSKSPGKFGPPVEQAYFPKRYPEQSNGPIQQQSPKPIVAPKEESSRMGEEELMEKLGQLDTKYREYSLEEIIYQLAKELFSKGLTNKETSQPEHSIQRFAHFVEAQAAAGRIPSDLEKSVLDTLVSALVDSISEKEKLNGLLRDESGKVAVDKSLTKTN